jgi:hypothetical protein
MPKVRIKQVEIDQAVNFNGNLINNLGPGLVGTDAVNLNQLQSNLSGLAWKNPARAATAVGDGNVTLNGPQTLDGVSLIAGQRAFVTEQTLPVENGLWVVQAGAWTRPTDFAAGDQAANTAVFISEGSTLADTAWVCTTDPPNDVIDTDALSFIQFFGGALITAGDGLVQIANQFDVVANPDGSITVNANDIQVGVLATDVQHGNRGGGALHAVAGAATAGFVGGLPAGATADGVAVLDATGKIISEGSITFPGPAGTFTFPSAPGAAGSVLTDNGAGILSFTAAATGTVTSVSATARGNVSSDTVTVANPTTTPAIDLTNIEINATSQNVAIGNGTAAFVDIGTANVLLGNNAGAASTGGTMNGATVIGSGALAAATLGGSGVVIGQGALGSATTAPTNPVVVGALAAQSMTGDSNVAIGGIAGQSLTTGSLNTFIGTQAGANTTTGGQNVMIGTQTTVAAGGATLNENIGIGAQVTVPQGTRNMCLGPVFGFTSASIVDDLTTIRNHSGALQYSVAFNKAGATAAQMQALDTDNVPAGSFGSLDTQELFRFDTQADVTNGSVIGLFVGARNPDTNVTAAQGSLYVDSSGPTLYQNQNGATSWAEVGGVTIPTPTQDVGSPAGVLTVADSNSGLTLSAAPTGGSVFSVTFNGVGVRIGNGVKTEEAYWSGDGGTTARAFGAVVSGDVLYYDASIINLDTSDEFVAIYTS